MWSTRLFYCIKYGKLGQKFQLEKSEAAAVGVK